MTKKLLATTCLLLGLSCMAGAQQPTINLPTQTKGVLQTTKGGTGVNGTATYPTAGTLMVTTTPAQQLPSGATLPAHCTPTNGNVFILTEGFAPGLYLCPVTDTWIFSSNSGISSINSLTASNQFLVVGADGLDFSIVSSSVNHTFNLPDASSTARGVVTTGAQTFAGNKTFLGDLSANSITVTSTDPTWIFGGHIRLGLINFADLGTPVDGDIVYCPDCDTPTTPGTTLCSSSGDKAGAEAHRIRGAWTCL